MTDIQAIILVILTTLLALAGCETTGTQTQPPPAIQTAGQSNASIGTDLDGAKRAIDAATPHADPTGVALLAQAVGSIIDAANKSVALAGSLDKAAKDAATEVASLKTMYEDKFSKQANQLADALSHKAQVDALYWMSVAGVPLCIAFLVLYYKTKSDIAEGFAVGGALLTAAGISVGMAMSIASQATHAAVVIAVVLLSVLAAGVGTILVIEIVIRSKAIIAQAKGVATPTTAKVINSIVPSSVTPAGPLTAGSVTYAAAASRPVAPGGKSVTLANPPGVG